MKTQILLWSIMMAISGCGKPYEFRGEDRPAYDRQVESSELEAMRARGIAVLDVRLREDFDADPRLIPDAMYRDPDDIEQWAAQMSPADGPLVVYCVHGRWVSQKAANFLKDRGFDVYTLEGGIEGWKADGRPTSPGNRP